MKVTWQLGVLVLVFAVASHWTAWRLGRGPRFDPVVGQPTGFENLPTHEELSKQFVGLTSKEVYRRYGEPLYVWPSGKGWEYYWRAVQSRDGTLTNRVRLMFDDGICRFVWCYGVPGTPDQTDSP